MFYYLKSTVMLSVQQDPTPDLNPDTLGALSALMLAQAQEIFVHKAIHGRYITQLATVIFMCEITDKMKESVVAKLASSCEDLYSECLKQFQRENLKNLFDREWISLVRFILFVVRFLILFS